MKRLVIGENVDLSNLILGGYVVNTETIKKRFDIKKGSLKYNLLYVNDVIIIMRRTAKTINYDIYSHLGEVSEDGYILTEEMTRDYDLQSEDEPVQEESNGIKKFSEIDIEALDKSKRVRLSQLEIKNAVLFDNEDNCTLLFEDNDGAFYVPVPDESETIGYSTLKIEEEFVFDGEVKKESVDGIVCDPGENFIKELDTKVFITGLKLEFNKQKFDEIYELSEGNKITRVYKKDFAEHKITKINLNGIPVYTYILTQEIDFSSYKVLFKAYKSTKKSAGITSKRFNKLESFLRY